MQKKYLYNGETYASSYAVRQAIAKAENFAFGPEPDEGKTEFWASLGVTYSEEPDPEPNIEDLRNQKRSALESAFMRWYQSDATCTSSLGFVVDSDSRAMMDVNGLVTTLEATPAETRGSVAFMDHDNVPHLLTLDQLKTVQLEIIKNGQAAYEQKWTMRSAIDVAQTPEELEAIEILFTGLDFTGGAA